MLLRHRLSGGRLRSVEDRIQCPEFPISHNLPEVLLGSKEGCSHPTFYHPTVTPPTNAAGSQANPGMWASMRLVVARHRCSEGGTSSRLMVKHSSSPSSKLAAADGYSRSSHSASFLSRAMPPLASIFHAARSTLLTWSF